MKFSIFILLLATAAGAQTPATIGIRAVTGMPYSAQQVTERAQTLADGTRITQPPQNTTLYRDSQGRTRTERTLTPGSGIDGVTFINIADPVAGVRYTLEPNNHLARQMSPPTPAAVANAAAAAQTRRPQMSHESLGTQTIEGVLAQGSRTTMVYPAGAFGNDRPITSTSEIWTSTELKIVVLSKTSDPRFGESTTTLTNISRAEPDPSLFQVPPGYQIVSGQ